MFLTFIILKQFGLAVRLEFPFKAFLPNRSNLINEIFGRNSFVQSCLTGKSEVSSQFVRNIVFKTLKLKSSLTQKVCMCISLTNPLINLSQASLKHILL